jgi:hypothetical protein
MLSISNKPIMLPVIMLSVVMLSVVAPTGDQSYKNFLRQKFTNVHNMLEFLSLTSLSSLV